MCICSKSNFVNVSSLSNQYNTLNGKFVMNGQGTQQFYVAGLNLGGFASSAQPSNETYFSNGSGTVLDELVRLQQG